VIGVFGGTFDPVHNGHLRIALDARELLGLDEVRLIPLAHAVHRDQPETPPGLRLRMLEAAVSGRTDLVCDNREMQRRGPSYTVDTLRSLHQEMPDASLCLLLGDDAFAGFAGWRDPEGILALANIAVMQRPGERAPRSATLEQILAGRISASLNPSRAGQVRFCPVTQLDIASRDIRRRIATGRSADFLVPPAVLALIDSQNLYLGSQNTTFNGN
jgi:nicotinate-nucleotide adenylyltransferase